MQELEQLFAPKLKKTGSLEGKFLVAAKDMEGSCFEKAIVYICAHDENGAVGVIVNQRIGSLNLKDAIKFDSEKIIKKYNKPFPVVFGGPVESSRFIILSMEKQSNKYPDKSITIHTDCDSFLSNYIHTNNDDKFIVAKGIAAWESNQLEQELEENAWLIADFNTDIVFSQRIKHKWDRIVKELGVRNFGNLVNYSGEA